MTDESPEVLASKAKAISQYDNLWSQFGKSIKMGVVEDAGNRNRLAKLLRVHTSKSPDKLVSLDTYVARMKPEQKQIYFIAGAILIPTVIGNPVLRAPNYCDGFNSYDLLVVTV